MNRSDVICWMQESKYSNRVTEITEKKWIQNLLDPVPLLHANKCTQKYFFKVNSLELQIRLQHISERFMYEAYTVIRITLSRGMRLAFNKNILFFKNSLNLLDVQGERERECSR